jgi:colicin import membrane protein
MARIGITFEQVAAAADALVGAGKQATIQAVREALGNTGSPNTIHKHLTAWRAARPQAVAAAVELPAELVNALGAEISRAAAKARAEIEGQLVQTLAEAAELSAAGEALEIERDELTQQVGTLTTERDQATATALEREQ